MRVAVLCNGPSRISYQDRNLYDFVIGCNIPWTNVDATVVVDEEVVQLWHNNPSLIQSPIYFSEKAWVHATTIGHRDSSQAYFAGILKVEQKFHSSGHNAVEVAIAKGATSIDIYGCDSWFANTAESYTRKFIQVGPNEEIRKMGKVNGWRERWKKIIAKHPNVEITFIK
jgi:hypothetical protein